MKNYSPGMCIGKLTRGRADGPLADTAFVCIYGHHLKVPTRLLDHGAHAGSREWKRYRDWCKCQMRRLLAEPAAQPHPPGTQEDTNG